MPQDDLNDRLTKSLAGNPQTRPDERRQYLGSLRERVALAVTNAELKATTTLPACRQALAPYAKQPGFRILLNGKLSAAILAPYLQLAQKLALPFTMVNDDSASLDADRYGLLLVNQGAIDQADIRLPKPATVSEKKHGFFDWFN